MAWVAESVTKRGNRRREKPGAESSPVSPIVQILVTGLITPPVPKIPVHLTSLLCRKRRNARQKQGLQK